MLNIIIQLRLIIMNIFLRYLRGKPLKKDSIPARKYLFIGLTFFIVSQIISRNKKSVFKYSCEDAASEKLFSKNKYFSYASYKPNILFVGPLQNIYFKYFATRTYLKSQIQAKENCDVITVETHNHRKKTNQSQSPCIFVISSSQGFDQNMVEAILRIHNQKIDVIGIIPKDFYNEQKLINQINELKNKNPKRKYYAIGMEYGANLMVNLSAKQPSLFQGLVSLANPLQLSLAEQQVNNSWFAKTLYVQDMIKGRLRLFHKQDQNCQNLQDVDKLLYNISDQKIAEWKKQHSSLYNIEKLKIPSLFIQSSSDQFCIPFSQISGDLISKQKCIYIETKMGGHNIWYQSSKNWAFLAAVQHIQLLDESLTNPSKTCNI